MRRFGPNDDMPEEYRDLLIKLLTIQANIDVPNKNYTDWIFRAPTLDDQWWLAKITMEELGHCRVFAGLLKELGIELGADDFIRMDPGERKLDFMKVSWATWADVGMFLFLTDRVGKYQLQEFMDSSYEPLAQVVPRVLDEEAAHPVYGMSIVQRICQTEEGRLEAQRHLEKWYPIALDMFGRSDSRNNERYRYWGLKKRAHEEMRRTYIEEVEPLIVQLGLEPPDPMRNRKYL